MHKLYGIFPLNGKTTRSLSKKNVLIHRYICIKEFLIHQMKQQQQKKPCEISHNLPVFSRPSESCWKAKINRTLT